MAGPCGVCGWRVAIARGLCRTCYGYRRRTGRDRPARVVVREVARVCDREAERNAWRGW